MNLMEAIKGRRSIRAYDSKPVEKEKIEAVLEAARLAPSARNRQKWQFIVVTDPEVKDKMLDACNNQQFIKQAPAVIVACGKEPGIMSCEQPVETIDVSIAVSFIILKAYEEGLGTCWLGNFNKDKVKAVLGIPENVSVVAVTPLGYPAESPDARPRVSLDEIVSWDKY
ncbi:MAG: nitroreductase family protein [Oscillospiraceae bacterium]|nr:nitroreductase family protein [Oscillospiraceae bacterium]